MEYPVKLEVVYPEKLSRLSTFFRFLLIIPQVIVLYFLGIVAGVIIFISWFAILFIGKYPRPLFDFMVGYFRWSIRVTGYSYLLTDKYPPFSMS